MAQIAHRARQRASEHVGALGIVLQQVIGHAPRGSDAHAGQAPQRLDQRDQRFGFGQ